MIYSYKNKKLKQDKIFEYNYEKMTNIEKIFIINDQEIIIYYSKDAIFRKILIFNYMIFKIILAIKY